MFERLERIARESLEANVVELRDGLGLTAGAYQFRSLWTRDFCLAVPGLLACGRDDVARSHLRLLYDARREDGLLPRTLDSMDAKRRVAWASLGRFVKRWAKPLPIGPGLTPEYRDQHGEEAVDGNPLAMLGALATWERTGDDEFWGHVREPARAALLRTWRQRRGGLVWQPSFSDWQDSVRRRGWTFYTNLLLWRASRRVAELDAPLVSEGLVEELEGRIRETFWVDGLFRSVAGRPQVSLEANLWAIEWGFAERDVWERLKASALWTRSGDPGFPTTPDWPAGWRNPGVRIVGLGHYHDQIRWSWLMAESAKTAAVVGDLPEARRILEVLEGMAVRDGAICEVYASEPPYLPWESRLYRSEAPFSWGAGKTLEALEQLRLAIGQGEAPGATRTE